MRTQISRRTVAAAAVVAAFAVLVPTATADQYFHTSHAELTPVGSASLRSGFVNDIHTNGVRIAAQERYQLNGAQPNTTYTVSLFISFADSTCAATDLVFPTTTFMTNAAGNGEAGFTFYQSSPPPPPNPQTVYIRWLVSSGGVPQYQTGCIPVVIGA
jgi:hypothetical protein